MDWFQAHSRALPWRRTPTLYGTWVSEIMLQQTTVAAVIPYWEKFMARFPNVQTLAAAPESEILSLWSGLGYYRRAKNLHRAARMVVDQGRGGLPTCRKEWQALPGVGTYASGAIASIGLGEVVPAVDANARRVLSRWFYDDPIAAGNLRPSELEELASRMVLPHQPGQWNEAVMELGATLCQAASVQCSQCPVLDQCKAGLAAVALEIPPPKKPKPTLAIAVATLVVRCEDKILLLPPGSRETVDLAGKWELGRADISGLNHGFWTLPQTPWYLATEKVDKVLDDPTFVRLWLRGRLNLSSAQIRACLMRKTSFGHSITHHRLGMRAWEIQIPEHYCNVKLAQGIPGHFLIPSTDTPVSKLVTKSLERFFEGIV